MDEARRNREAGVGGLAVPLGRNFGDGSTIAGIDLSFCLADGKLAPWAKKILDIFYYTYSEYSADGRGMKILFRVRPIAIREIKEILNFPPGSEEKRWAEKGANHNPPAIRLYFSSAFSTTDKQYGTTGEVAIILLKAFDDLREAIPWDGAQNAIGT